MRPPSLAYGLAHQAVGAHGKEDDQGHEDDQVRLSAGEEIVAMKLFIFIMEN